ncbi:PREDICTED: NKG2-A/NKG2-B type II integral membrane protein-like [Chrysochloris asiatica]|uniref:NKG2-A/NKG2-B type II integral membrane protein-like n=1 Tax=Chrysochloris asiatica TaxID=185453 RepID=A0A9B0U8K7_CHRAS|nr:PREDICTED: NKG2-A/NKG2-B type II integral membrane protein-like [Chrysochloris asiatica]
MSNQRVIYSEIKLTKYLKGQQIKTASKNSSISDAEQGITYAELTLHNPSCDLQGNDKNSHCKDFPSFPGRLISGILEIICIFLLASVITVTVIDLDPYSDSSSFIGVHCNSCPETWFIYSNNCYYISVERKTWNESWMDCASKKSNLLYIENEDEMNFMNLLNILPWIGFIDKSTSSSKQFSIIPEGDKSCPYFNFYKNNPSVVSCVELKIVVCKSQALLLT